MACAFRLLSLKSMLVPFHSYGKSSIQLFLSGHGSPLDNVPPFTRKRPFFQARLSLSEGTAACAHEDGLTPLTSNFDANVPFKFFLLASSSRRLLSDVEDPDDPENIEAG
ncbi:unnamed protein product [Fraxinus pennsylvanica]|uniref:Uncharacterized protein n=1 Tax=Fraxinus pennsylvanica TaxID=56036 RepID=A0AAD1Z2Y9_9LAMI|nr:unnamed protein product [Fraxinus pennsylvanica]